MNTLTIAVLFVCATMAYASALPGAPSDAHAAAPVAEADELFEAQENRYHGGGGRYHGGGGGRYHGGGGRYHGGGGGYRGGGGYHKGGHYG